MSWGLQALYKSNPGLVPIPKIANQPPHPVPARHVHDFSAYTSLNFGHVHVVSGTTAAAKGGLDRHTHFYEGATSFSANHFHYFRGRTSVAVPLTGGGHGHWITGVTSINNGHYHSYRWFTGPELPTTE